MKEKYYEGIVDKLFSQTFICVSSNGNESVALPFSEIRINLGSFLNDETVHIPKFRNFLYCHFNVYTSTNYGCQSTDWVVVFKMYMSKVRKNIFSLPTVKLIEPQIIID